MPADIPAAPGWTDLKLAEMAASFSNELAGSSPRGATAMTPSSRSPVCVGNLPCQVQDVSRQDAAALAIGVVVQAHLDEACQRPAAGPFALGGHGFRQRGGELWPVHRVHGVGVPHHGFCLVALQLSDEVPSERQLLKLSCLAGRFLVPVLADVGDAQRCQDPDVLRRMKLRDHNQLGRPVLPARGRRGRVYPAPDSGQVVAEPGLPVRVRRVRSRLSHRSARGRRESPQYPPTPGPQSDPSQDRRGKRTAFCLQGCSHRCIQS